MHIEMYESELRKVAKPTDVDELLKGITTKRRLQEKASKSKRRLSELDAIIASPKAPQLTSPWQTALEGGDQYGGLAPWKEAAEERQYQSDDLAFTEAAIEDSRSALDSALNRVSLPFCQRERPLIAKDIQAAVDSLEQAAMALARAVARRDKLDDMGIKTDSIPSFVAPQILEHVAIYFHWIKANYPEIKIP